MSDVVDRLKNDFRDPDYRHTYSDGFLNSFLATQIKVLREERSWTQAKLADEAKMNQSRISELEDVNFDSWTIRTLRKLCRAFDLRLKISFEDFGTMLTDFRNLDRQSLSRHSFAKDPAFNPPAKPPQREQSPSLPFASNQRAIGLPSSLGSLGTGQAILTEGAVAARGGQAARQKAEILHIGPATGWENPIQRDLSQLQVPGVGQ